eukprot:2455703-Prorocentrum_lima.AAC.1
MGRKKSVKLGVPQVWESQGTILIQYATPRNVEMQEYTWESVQGVVHELLCAPRNALEDSNIRAG